VEFKQLMFHVDTSDLNIWHNYSLSGRLV